MALEENHSLKYLPIKIVCFQYTKTLVFHFYFFYVPLCSQVNIILMVKAVLICLFLTSVSLKYWVLNCNKILLMLYLISYLTLNGYVLK